MLPLCFFLYNTSPCGSFCALSSSSYSPLCIPSCVSLCTTSYFPLCAPPCVPPLASLLAPPHIPLLIPPRVPPLAPCAPPYPLLCSLPRPRPRLGSARRIALSIAGSTASFVCNFTCLNCEINLFVEVSNACSRRFNDNQRHWQSEKMDIY